MTPERWKQVEEIYQAALDRDPADRTSFLDDTCRDDDDLRREVLSLLEAHEPGDPFLESPALEIAARTLAAETIPLSRGQRIGAYQLIAPIGSGGMGEVWRAMDPALNRHVAIKFVLPQYSRDPERLKRFEREARATGMLNHPNVVAIYAIGNEAGRLFVVTELLEGMTLRQRISEGAVQEARAIEYTSQVAQGLSVAHDKGIVHRDLKPENVFVTADGQVKILDFGLAKLLPRDAEDETLTVSGMVVGTPAYMAPEQVRGQRADVRSDLFSLGVILYEMVSGRRPFSGQSSAETMNAILKDDPPPIPHVSPLSEQIIRHALEKDPKQRFQSARDLNFQLKLLLHPSAQSISQPSTAPRSRTLVWILATLAVALISAGGAWMLTQRVRPNPMQIFTQLTFDSGLTTDPALSPDGKLLAFASDRSGAGNLDIWLQQVGRNESLRLTDDPSDDVEPSFHPDGTRIAYRSGQRGGGIYVVSTLGGTSTLIAPQGRRPRFSPDGSKIAYTIGLEERLFVIASTGGTPVELQPEFAMTRFPVWSPNGKNILFLGQKGRTSLSSEDWDWWVSGLDGGSAVKTGISSFLRKHGLPHAGARTLMPLRTLAPRQWTTDNRIVFVADTGDSRNIWQIEISPSSFTPSGSPQRLTSGSGPEDLPSTTSEGNRIAYCNLNTNIDIWSLTLNSPRTSAMDELLRLTTSPALDIQPAVSAGGQRLVFASNRAGNYDIWSKNLATGVESAITISPGFESRPAITPDGSKVAFNDWASGKPRLLVVPLTSQFGDGVAKTVCSEDCFVAWDWSPDNRYLLYWSIDRKQVGALELSTGRKAIVLKHPDFPVLRPNLSPDGNWVAFDALIGPDRVQLFIAPFLGMTAPGVDTWIPVTEGGAIVDTIPRWSPGGDALYFLSNRDSNQCFWRQQLDLNTKRPTGEAKDVFHLHGARRSLSSVPSDQLDISLARDKLIFPMSERTGNIWMAEWKH